MTTFLDYVADHRLAGCFALTLLGLRREKSADSGGAIWTWTPGNYGYARPAWT